MLESLKDINLRDLDLILEALDEFKHLLKHDDEKALLTITTEKIQLAHIEQINYLTEMYSK